MKVIKPKLILEDSAAGSLTITLPSTNVGYNLIEKLITDISVRKNDNEIWAGRVISEDMDFWNNRTLYCEGELAFLNDTTQPPAEYHDISVRDFLITLIDIHNSKVVEYRDYLIDDSSGNSITDSRGNSISGRINLPSNRQFQIGSVTVYDDNDSLYRYTNYEKTIECINEKLIDRLGGHLRVRKNNGIRYLDYLQDYPNTNSQTIEFGENLVDFTRNWDESEFATVIVPLGNRLDEDEKPADYPAALDAYLTVESVNNGSIYVKSDEAINKHGWIEKVVHWDDVSIPANLLTKARDYLENLQFDSMTIELSALDLHYMDVNYEDVKLLDLIKVVSVPHGMNRWFPVKKLEIPLDSPENTIFRLGDKIKTSLTGVNNKTNSEILKKIEELPKESKILDDAKANALEIIKTATNGYITIVQNESDYHTEELIVSDTADPDNATRKWVWNVNGLAYFETGKEPGLALTMDGSIVANRITTGTMRANRIRAGQLTDEYGYNYWNLSTGEFRLTPGMVSVANNVSLDSYVTGTVNTAITSYDTNLNQEKVFNKLTNNGSAQGIYLSGNKLYVNADYIKTGTLSADYIKGGTLVLGGRNNTNGKLSVLNYYGEEICSINNQGAVIKGTLYNEQYSSYIQINEARFHGGRVINGKKNLVGSIKMDEDFTLWNGEHTSEWRANGIHILAQGINNNKSVLVLSADNLLVNSTHNPDGPFYMGHTGWANGMKFVNGIMVEF